MSLEKVTPSVSFSLLEVADVRATFAKAVFSILFRTLKSPAANKRSGPIVLASLMMGRTCSTTVRSKQPRDVGSHTPTTRALDTSTAVHRWHPCRQRGLKQGSQTRVRAKTHISINTQIRIVPRLCLTHASSFTDLLHNAYPLWIPHSLLTWADTAKEPNQRA